MRVRVLAPGRSLNISPPGLPNSPPKRAPRPAPPPRPITPGSTIAHYPALRRSGPHSAATVARGAWSRAQHSRSAWATRPYLRFRARGNGMQGRPPARVLAARRAARRPRRMPRRQAPGFPRRHRLVQPLGRSFARVLGHRPAAHVDSRSRTFQLLSLCSIAWHSPVSAAPVRLGKRVLAKADPPACGPTPRPAVPAPVRPRE